MCTPEAQYRKYRIAEELQKSCAVELMEERARGYQVAINSEQATTLTDKITYVLIGAALAIIVKDQVMR